MTQALTHFSGYEPIIELLFLDYYLADILTNKQIWDSAPVYELITSSQVVKKSQKPLVWRILAKITHFDQVFGCFIIKLDFIKRIDTWNIDENVD